jgi:ABC-type oligopeptide transport system ATPase subunit
VLVADEAGLGKTTVASEVVRQVKNLDGVLMIT